MEATFSHVLGSEDPIEVDAQPTDFNESQFTGFMQDLFDEEAPENDKEHESDLTQTGAVPPPVPTEQTEFRTTFSMNGAPHTLWLEYVPRPVLKMASGGDDELDAKLRNEIALVEQQKQALGLGDDAELLAAKAQSARSLLKRSVAVEKSLAELESESHKNTQAGGLEEIVSGLETFGDQFDESDLPSTPPTPVPPTGAEVEVDSKGRYVIKTREQLDAVRAAKPTRPDDLEAELEDIWTRYAGPKGYFDEALRMIEQDLSRPRPKIRHDPPLTWPAYIASRTFYDSLSQRKEFQTELRDTIRNERGDIDPANAEIDVGFKKGNRKVRYADLVISNPEGNLEVYSVKVHNIFAQTQKAGSDDMVVRGWIRETLKTDVDEAADSYGGTQTFRRPYKSTPAGRVGERSDGPHPLFNQKVFINKVILVWRGNSDLVPERFRQYILDTGRDLGIDKRSGSRIKVEVTLVP